MSDGDTQLKIMLVSLFLSAVVVCVCFYARPQQPAYAVVKATTLVHTASY